MFARSAWPRHGHNLVKAGLRSISAPTSPFPSVIVQHRTLRVQPTFTGKMSGSPPYHNLTLYTFGTPNGQKASITLEELGLQYKLETIDISKNVQKEPWYLAINPNGRIPALKDGDMRLFESGAIMLYLIDHYDPDNKISYKHGSPEYYEMISWLMWQMGGLGPMQGL